MASEETRNMGKMIKIVILFVMLITSLQCNQKANERKIIVFTGCDNIEIVQDIELSISNNLKLIKEKHIIVEMDSVAIECGYKLLKNTDEMKIETALTDVDLMITINEFYN